MEARSAPAIEGGPDLRASLGIPADATVFCRHGGMPTFNVPFVRTAVARFAERRPDVYFVLLNTPRLDSKTRANVVHLPAIFDEAKKKETARRRHNGSTEAKTRFRKTETSRLSSRTSTPTEVSITPTRSSLRCGTKRGPTRTTTPSER